MATRILFRYDTSANWAAVNPVLAQGEIGLDLQIGIMKIGDGARAWNALPSTRLTVKFMSIDELDDPREFYVGSAPRQMEILPAAEEAGRFAVQANSSAPLGVQRVPYTTSLISDISNTGAEAGNTLRFNGAIWENASLQEIIGSLPQKFIQNVILGQAGYFSRGQPLFQSASTSVSKFSFPSDSLTVASPSPETMSQHAGFANPGVAGYFSRGQTLNAVNKWAFPVETVSTTTSALNAMDQHAGFSNPRVAGYFSRGAPSSDLVQTAVFKWAFSSDVVTMTTVAPNSMARHAGFANDAVAGYFSRGWQFASAPDSATVTVYKWTFPTDTTSTTTNAPEAMAYHAGFANTAVAGYFNRGAPAGQNWGTVYKWSFPTDVVSTPWLSSSTPISYNGGFSNPSVAGYFSSAGTTFSGIYKWNFSTDTLAVATNTFVGYNNAGFANA